MTCSWPLGSEKKCTGVEDREHPGKIFLDNAKRKMKVKIPAFLVVSFFICYKDNRFKILNCVFCSWPL
jgi:hypothetical protein